MNKKLGSILQYVLFLGIGIFLVWWSLQQIPADKWGEFKAALSNARYWLVFPVFLILTASHVLRALRWKILIEPMGYHPSLPNAFFAVMVGYLANLAVPRLGEVLKCTILARYEKVPAQKLVGTIVAERAFDVISLALVFVLAFILQFDIVGQYAINLFQEAFQDKAGNINANKLVILLCIIIAIIGAIIYWFKQFAHLAIVEKIKHILLGIWEGISSVRKLRQKGLFIVYSAAIWILYIVGTWVGLFAIEATSHLSLADAISALAFASIGMILTPGGIGAYAFFIAKVLELSNVPFEMGYANGTLQWLAQFGIVLLMGFISLGLLPIYNRKRTHEKS
jgi:uncharacterized protein (TIRG00374 family)